MCSDHPNVARYCRLLDAYRTGDEAEIERAIAPDISCLVPGRSVLAGEYRGRAEYARYHRLTRELSDGSLAFQPVRMLGSDDAVAVYGRLTGECRGRRLDTEICYLFTLEEGVLTESRIVPFDLYAYDDFWGPA